MKRSYLVHVSALALAATAVPAFAQVQDSSANPAQSGDAGQTMSQPGAPDTVANTTSEDTGQLGDIVVTAQRRAERAQEVPISISVVGGESLQQNGSRGLQDIRQLVPSVQFDPNNGGGFNIRGIGTQAYELSAERAVSIVLDDVVQDLPRDLGINGLADIERIEVLRGPQGIQFGKNSSAGVISVITKRDPARAIGHSCLLLGMSVSLAACATIFRDPLSQPILTGASYVAMGGSFAAGPGVTASADQPPDRCAQSKDNYAHLLARRLNLRLVDVSCSGATTAHLLGPWENLPAQVDMVTSDTQLVTVTIGGNDVGYIGALGSASCRFLGAPPPDYLGGNCPDAPAPSADAWTTRGRFATRCRRSPPARTLRAAHLRRLFVGAASAWRMPGHTIAARPSRREPRD